MRDWFARPRRRPCAPSARVRIVLPAEASTRVATLTPASRVALVPRAQRSPAPCLRSSSARSTKRRAPGSWPRDATRASRASSPRAALTSPTELATHAEGARCAPERLRHVDDAARLLADAIARARSMLIVADYDADGATACAVGVRALRAFGADGRLPRAEPLRARLRAHARDRARGGRSARPTCSSPWTTASPRSRASRRPIASACACWSPTTTCPGAALPDAACIVNPNQAGCGFPSKHLAGVGVIFYVMLALRAELRRRGAFAARSPSPTSGELLDLVALGTVADVVRLDANNRILVAQGLARIRAGKACARHRRAARGRGTRRRATRTRLRPRLRRRAAPERRRTPARTCRSASNACSPTTRRAPSSSPRELDRAQPRAARDRGRDAGLGARRCSRAIEAGDGYTLALHRPEWHAGVVGMLASRLKDRFHRPVFAFASESRRAPQGLGALDPGAAPARCARPRGQAPPGTDRALRRARGRRRRHASPRARFDEFRAAFEAVARELLTPADLEQRIETDGELEPHGDDLRLRAAHPRPGLGPGLPRAALRRDASRSRRSASSASATSSSRSCLGGRRFPRDALRHAPTPLPAAHRRRLPPRRQRIPGHVQRCSSVRRRIRR